MLVEEVDILDEHEATTGGHRSKEPVQNACRFVRFEARRACTPCGGSQGERFEEDKHGQSSLSTVRLDLRMGLREGTYEESAEPHNDQTTDSQHEDVARGRLGIQLDGSQGFRHLGGHTWLTVLGLICHWPACGMIAIDPVALP